MTQPNDNFSARLLAFVGLRSPRSLLIPTLVVLTCIVALSLVQPFGGAIAVWRLAFLPAALYLVAAIGYGCLFAPLVRSIATTPSTRFHLQATLGLSFLIFLSHTLGTFGLFGNAIRVWLGTTIAIGTIAVGLGLALFHGWRSLVRAVNAQPLSALQHAADAPRPPNHYRRLGIGLTLAAATLYFLATSSPPGYLWDTEFGGFDSLSYHLALPQEWLNLGRIATLDHNVYSALPSGLEAAFYHIAAAMQPISTPSKSLTYPAAGMLGSFQDPTGTLLHGGPLFSAQILHALCTALAASTIAALTRSLLTAAGTPQNRIAAASSIAFLFVLLTPWSLVVGTLAYNEMAMLALGAAAMLCAVPSTADQPSTKSTLIRASFAAFLLAGACLVKPTALLFFAPPAALLFLFSTPRRQLIPLVLIGTPLAVAIGLAVLGPYLWRNHLATGNPLFPFAAKYFPSASGGTGTWSAEQVARFTAAHRFDGAFSDRLRLLFLPDATGSHRGIRHPQWGSAGLFLIFSAVALFITFAQLLKARALASQQSRLALAILFMPWIQVAVWLTTTHLQSRFLIPLLATLPVFVAALLTLAWHEWLSAPKLRFVRFALLTLTCIAALGWPITTFLGQRLDPTTKQGQPTLAIESGVPLFTGELYTKDLTTAWAARDTQTLQLAYPIAALNTFPGSSGVLLLGDATPLYLTRPTRYSTTYDTNPGFGLLSKDPSESDRASADLRASNTTLVLLNEAELRRYERSGWLDPRLDLSTIPRLLQRHRIIMAWPNLGVVLIELQPSPNHP